MKKPSASKYLKIGEAAKLLGVSIDTLRRWEKAGKITAERTPGGTRLYSLSALKKINPSSVQDFETSSVSTEELLKKTTEPQETSVFRAEEASVWETSFESTDDQPAAPKAGLKNYFLTKFLMGSALIMTITLILTSWIAGSYLTNPKEAKQFFKNNIASGFLKPFHFLAEESIAVLDPKKAQELGFFGPEPPPAGRHLSSSPSSSVLAVTASSQFLEINSDTQINGALFVRDAINGLTMEATSSAGTMTFTAGSTTLTVTKTAKLDQDVSTAAGPTFSTLNLSAKEKQLTFQSGGPAGIVTWTPTAERTITLPDATTTLVGINNTQTLTNKSMSGSSNTFTNIPNSALTNSKVTVTAGTNLSGGGDVTLGSSITIALKDSPAVTSITTSGIVSLADGTAAAPALTFTSDLDTGLYRIGTNKIGLITAGSATSGITIDASGNVGIGTISPSANLAISGNVGIGFTGTSSAAPNLGLAVAGNIGIGTTSPNNRLQVVGGAVFGTDYNQYSAPSNGVLIQGNVGIGSTGSANYNLDIWGTTRITSALTVGGNVGVGASVNTVSAGIFGSVGTSTLSVSGASSLSTLTVSGNTGIGASASITGLTYALGGLRVNGFSDLTGNVGIGASANITSNLYAGSIFTPTLSVSGAGYFNTITTAGNVGIGASVNTVSAGIFGSVGTSTLSVSGASSLSTLTVSGNTGIGASASITGLTYALGGLRVNGFSDLTGNVGVGGTASFNSLVYSTGSFMAGNGSATAPAYSFTSSTSTGLWSPSANALSLTTSGSGTSGLTVTAEGNVGIGITTAVGKLQINGSAGIGYGTITGVFPSNGLAVSGNVGIGTTSPATALHVVGQTTVTNKILANHGGIDIGTTGIRFGTIYSDTINATTLIGTVEGGQTNSADWTINADNATDDGQEMSLTFKRGTASPNAVLGWDITNKEFDLNSGLNITGTITPTYGITLTSTVYDITTGANQHLVLWPNGTGNVGIGTTSPGSYLSVAGNSTIGFGGTTTISGPSNGLGISGNLGVGTTSPNNKLQVIGAGVFGADYGQYSAPSNGLLVQGNIGIGFTSPAATLDVIGTTLLRGTAGTYGLAVTNNGNVGIGTTSPTEKLFVAGGNIKIAHPNKLLFADSGGLDGLRIYIDGNIDAVINQANNASLIFNTSNIERMRIDGSGNVGIGTTDPGSTLAVNGNGVFGFGGATSIAGPTNGLAVSGNLGVGTTSPNNKLQVIGAGVFGGDYGQYSAAANGLLVQGNVGIGATTSSNKLDVWGNARIAGTLTVDSTLTNNSVFRAANGSASAPAYSFSNLTDAGLWSAGGGLLLTTGGSSTSGITVTAAGNVGIGTTSPSALLQLYKSTVGETEGLRITNPEGTAGNSAALTIFANDQYAKISAIRTGADAGADFVISATYNDGGAGTLRERLRIAETGNVGIGNSNPGAMLSLSGNAVIGFGGATSIAGPSNGLAVSGNVGIGTTSTETMLNVVTVASGDNALGQFMNRDYTTGDRTFIQARQFANANGSTSAYFGQGQDQKLYIVNNDLSNYQYAMVFTHGGELGIGTTAPGSYLGVIGNTSIGATYGNIAAPTSGLIVEGNVGIGTTTANSLLSVAGGAHIGSARQGFAAPTDGLFVDGNVGIGTTTSSNKLDVWGNARIAGTGTFDSTLTALNGLIGYSGVTAPTSGLAVSGNVGIGTTNPSQKLDVNGYASASSGFFGYESIQIGQVQDTTGYRVGWTDNAKNLVFGTNNTENMRITSGGNVGIGFTSPAAKLDVQGSFQFGEGNTELNSSAEDNFLLRTRSNTPNPNFGIGIGDGAGGWSHTPISWNNYLDLNGSGLASAQGGTTSHIRITETGNVGIGTTGPGSSLSVSGNSTFGFGRATSIAGPSNGLGISGNLGVGTTTPNNKLQVIGAGVFGANYGQYSAPANGLLTEGNVGIGATTSVNKLDVWGNARIAGTGTIDSTLSVGGITTLSASNGALSFTGSTPSITSGSSVFGLFAGGNVGIGTTGNLYGGLTVRGAGTGTNITLQTYGSGLGQGLTVLDNGNVGIGTTGPGAILDIRGNLNGATLNDAGVWLYDTTAYAQNVGAAIVLGGQVNTGVNSTMGEIHAGKENATAGNTASYLRFATRANGGAVTEKMRIDSAGNVGIGASTVNSTLAIVGSAHIGSARQGISAPTDGLFVDGNVGIGATSAAYNLDLWGTGRITSALTVGGNIGIGASVNAASAGIFGSLGTSTLSVSGASSLSTLTVSGNTGIGASASVTGLTYALGGLRVNGYSDLTGNVGIGGTASFTSSIYSQGSFYGINGSATAPAYSFTSSTITGLWSPSANALSLTTSGSGTSGITVTAGGNVGIGGTAPGTKLDVAGEIASGIAGAGGTAGKLTLQVASATETAPYISTNTSGYLEMYAPTGWMAYNPRDGHQFQINGTPILNLTSGATDFQQATTITTPVDTNLTLSNTGTGNIILSPGNNVGIGTTVPQAKLSIQGNVGIGYTGANQSIPVNGLAVSGNVGVGITTANSTLSVAGGAHIGSARQGISAPTDGLLVDGNVGIGATSAAYNLDLWGTGRITSALTVGGNIGIGASVNASSAGIFGSLGTSTLSVSGNTTLSTLTTSGNAGIGGSASITSLLKADSGLTVAGTTTLSGSFTLGDNGDLGNINTSDWDISQTGDLSGIGTISADGVLTLSANNAALSFTGSTPSITSGSSVFGLFAGGNVGIGTTGNLYGGLTVRGAGTTTGITLQTYGSGLGQGLTVLDNGNVGIGTTGPTQKLHVNGDIVAYNVSNSNSGRIQLGGYEIGGSNQYGDIAFSTGGYNSMTLSTYYSDARNFINFKPGNVETMRLLGSGNVGIGLTTANSQLSISNNVHIGSLFQGTAAPTNGLFVDGNVGVGATSTAYNLDIWGTGRITSALTVGGNIGVGASVNTSSAGIFGSLRVNGFSDLTGNVGIGGTAVFNSLVVSSGHLIPSANDIYDLGTDSLRWRDLYLGPGTLHLGTSTSDEYTLSYDTSNNNLGFNINGSGPAEITFDSSGNVGIGTTAPQAKLSIQGNVGIGYTGVNQSIPVNGLAVFGNVGVGTTTANSTLSISGSAHIGSARQGTSAPTDGLFVDGNVGIGTTTSSNMLDVWGNARIAGTGIFDSTLTALNGLIGYSGVTAPTSGLAISGNVGIGFSSPTVPLYVYGSHPSNTKTLRIGAGTGDAGAAAKFYKADGIDVIDSPLYLQGNYNQNVLLAVGGGNVGINDEAPGVKLSVVGNAQIGYTSGIAGPTNGLAVFGNVGIGTSTANSLLSVAGGAHIGSALQGFSAPTDGLFVDGNVGIGATSTAYNLDLWGTGRITSALTVGGNIGVGASVNAASAGIFGSLRVNGFSDLTGNVGIGGTASFNSLVYSTGSFLAANGSATAPSYSFTSSTNTGLWSPSANALSLTTNGSGTSGLTVTANGNVGIGTTAPGVKLDVRTTSANSINWAASFINPHGNTEAVSGFGSGIKLQVDNGPGWWGPLKWVGLTAIAESNYGNDLGLAIYTQGNMGSDPGNAPTEKVRLSAAGNLGIGTSSPLSLLSVAGSAHIGSARQGFAAPTDGLFVDGNVGIGATTSSNKLDVWGNARIAGTLTVDSTLTNSSVFRAANGSASAPAYSFTSLTNAGLWTNGDGLLLTTGGSNTSGITVTGAGNVGIGTTAPAVKLDFGTSVTNVQQIINIRTNGNQRSGIGMGAGDGAITLYSADNEGGVRFGVIAAADGTTWTQYMHMTQTGDFGIGADAPGSKLSVNGGISAGTYSAAAAPSNGMIISGSVGIGTSVPQARLSIQGNVGIGYTGANQSIPVNGLAVFGNVGVGITTANSTLSVAGGAHIGSARQGISAPTDGLFVDGNVGIGTTTSSNKLDVWGNARITGTGTIDSTLSVGGITTLSASNGALSFTGLTPSLTSGSSVFGLFAGGNVGIGTTGNLYGGLTVKGAGTGTNIALQTYGSGLGQGLSVLDNGNVGIGTTGPGELLHLYSSVSDTPILKVENANADANPSYLYLVKNSISPAANDRIGQITFQGNDSGGNMTSYGTIEAYSADVTNGSEDGETRFGTLANGLWQYMVLKSGNVGIGTTSPLSLLSVAGGAHIGSIRQGISAPTDGLLVDGNVGVGATSTAYNLDIWGTGRISSALTVGGNIGVGASVNVTSAGIFGSLGTSTLSVSGNSTLNTLTTSGNTGIGASASITGLTYSLGGLRVNGFSDLTGNVGIGTSLSVSSASILDSLSVTKSISGASLGISGNVGIGASVNTVSAGIFGSLGTSTLSVSGASSLSTLTVSGNTGIGASASITGLTYALGGLRVNGYSDLTGNVGVGGTAVFNSLVVSSGHLIPSANDIYDLGADSLRWRDLYLGPGTLHLGTSISDEYTLSYDTSNNNLGFNINGSGPAEITFDSSGNVGIGTTAPQAKLSIQGNVGIGYTGVNQAIPVNGLAVSGNVGIGTTTANSLLSVAGGAHIGSIWQGAAAPANGLLVDGNVGIGFTTPAATLDVIGTSFLRGTGGTYGLTVTNAGLVGIGTTSPTALFAVGPASNFTVTATGNTITGDNVAIGSVDDSVALAINASSITSTTSQYGILVNPTLSSAATAGGIGVQAQVKTAAAAYTMTNAYDFYAQNPSKGAGSAITNAYGLYLDDITAGATKNYGIYASGATNLNYFGGNVGIGDASPEEVLTVLGNTKAYRYIINNNETDWVANSANPVIYGSADNSGAYPYNANGHLILQPRTSAANDIIFALNLGSTTPSSAMVIKGTSGNVGIGNTSPTGLFEIGNAATPALFVASATGNVGIGTTGPGDLLHVRNASGVANLRLEGNSGNPGLMFYVGSTLKAQVYEESGDDTLRLGTGTGAQTDLVINSGGNVGIGTDSPDQMLELSGSGATPFMLLTSTTNTVQGMWQADGTNSRVDFGTFSNHLLRFMINNTAVGAMNNSGNLGIGITSPTSKLHLYDTNETTTQVRVENDNSIYHAGITLSNAVNDWDLINVGGGTYYSVPGGSLAIFDGSSPRMVIDTGGNIGMGTVSSVAQLDVRNTNTSTGLHTYIGSSAGQFAVLDNGNVGIGTTGPGAMLQVGGATNRYAQINSAGQATFRVDDNSAVAIVTLENRGIAAADQGLNLLFNLGDGTNAVEGGAIRVFGEQDWTTTAATQDSYMAFRTTLNGTAAEYMRITSGGNVGIGTSVPGTFANANGKLDVLAPSIAGATTLLNNSPLMIGHTVDVAGDAWGLSLYRIGDTYLGGGMSIRHGTVDESKSLDFWTNTNSTGANPTVKMTILGNGNVGIGTTSPAVKLDSVSTSTQLRLSYSSSKYVNFTTSADGILTIAPDTGNSVVLDQSNVLRPAAQNGLDLGDATNTWSSIYFGNQSKPTDGSMTAPPYSFNSDPNTGMYSISGDILGFSTGGTARMAINSSGNVGIGTTSPTGELEVGSPTGQADIYINSATGNNANLWLRSGNTDTLGFEAQSGLGAATGVFISNRIDGGAINFRTTSTTLGTRMTIASNGNVGINDDTPSYTLEVAGTLNVTGAVTCGSGCAAGSWVRATSPINVIIPNTAGDSLGLLSGNVGIGTTAPANKLEVIGDAHISTNLSVGGAVLTDRGIQSQATTLTGIDQYGIVNSSVFNESATAAGHGIWTYLATKATSFTMANGFGLYIAGAGKGAGSTITSLYGQYIAAQTQGGTNNYGLYIAGASGGSGVNAALYVDSGNTILQATSGNVGIGFTSPQAKLQVNVDTGGELARFTSNISGDSYIRVDGGTTQTYFGTNRSSYGFVGTVMDADFAIRTNNTNKIYVKSGGNVGIGTDSPVAQLSIPLSGSTMPSARWNEEIIGVYGNTTTQILASRAGNNSGGPTFELFKVRGTQASPATAVAGDDLGGISFGGYNNAARNSLSFIRARAASGWAATGTDTPSDLSFWTTPDGSSSTLERMIISSAGDVGIGSSVPQRRVEIIAASGPRDTTNDVNNQVALYLSGDPSSSGRPILQVHRASQNTGSSETLVSFISGGSTFTVDGTITANNGVVSYGGFSGSHYARTTDSLEKGMLVSVTGSNLYLNNSEEPVYSVSKTTTANDSKVLGSYISPYEIRGTDNTHLIASVGNGMMWVVDNGVNITTGDNLISSSTAGHAMVDPGTFETAHVVAKVSENVDWSTITETVDDNGTLRKHKKVSVFFTLSDISRPAAIRNFSIDGSGALVQNGNFNTTGNVGIGTTDPGSYKLYVNGSGFLNDTAWTYASDSRLKENISSIGTGLDVITALNPVTFDYINGGQNRSGFIAQEVQQVLPDLVSQRADGMLTLRTDEILPYAVKGIQELSNKLSALEESLKIDEDGTLNVAKLKAGSITLDPALSDTAVELADAGIVDSTTEPVIEIKSKLADLEKRLAALEEKDSVKESTSSAVASIASASAQLIQASSSAEINTGRDDIAWKLTAPDVLFATSSAQLANLQVHSEATVSGQLTAYNLNVSEGFKSFGKTALSDTVVAGTLTVDGTLSIENGSEINVIGKLYLQKSILADSLDILNGAFTFDKDGTLEAKGTVLATQFAVKKGSSTGKGTIVKGSLDTIIENTYVDEDSVILITPNKALNQTIAVADKIKGGFLVELAKAEETDITFDYLIVGVK